MRYLLLLITISIPSIFYAQVTKPYSGEFYDGTTQPGKATYSYYEENNERIKHGEFTYTRSVKSIEGVFNSSITGSFRNNFKDGNWNHSISFTDWDNGTGNYITGTIILSTSYIDGLPNGQWNYSEVSKSRMKTFTMNGYAWSSYTESKTSKAVINFKGGKLAGGFTMEGFLLSDSYKATFDDNGFFVKNLTISYSPTFREESSVEYYKNTMINSLTRDKSTGEVKEKVVLTPEEISIIQKFSEGQITSKDLRNFGLRVDTVKLITLETFEMNIFRSSFFLNEYLQGDKAFDGSFDFGGYHIYTTKYDLKRLSDIEDMNIAEEYFQENKNNIYNIEHSLERFEGIRNKYKNNLSMDDLAIVEAKILECNNIIEKFNLFEKEKDDRYYEWSEISGFRSSNISELEIVLDKAKKFQENYKDYLTENDKNLANYSGSGIITTAANNDKELVEERIIFLEKYLKSAIKNEETQKQNAIKREEQKRQEDLVKEFNQNTETIYGYQGQFGRGSKFKAVEDLYVVRDAGYNIIKINKKNLYNAYEIAKRDLEEKRNGFSNDLQKAIETGNIIIKLCDKMISLASENTDELEKKVKNEKDPQTILDIIGI
jgi:hypothetical protein